MRVGIVGAGAVGLGLGSCLLAAGEDVHFLARDDVGAAALARAGISRTGFFGAHRASPDRFTVSCQPEDLARAACDAVLVCTKSTQTAAVSRTLAEAFGAHGPPPVVLCQNGWGNAERAAAWLPRERIFSARVITGFRRLEPGAVDITVHADVLSVGSLFGADPARLAPLCDAVSRGGVPCHIAPDIERDLWAKMLYNCLLNPLGALVGVPYGALGQGPHTRAILRAVAEEIFAVLDASPHATHWTSAPDYLETFFGTLLPPTAAHESSMLQDLRAGRETEIDALSGAVVRLGAAHGVATPVNAALATLIRTAEARSGAAG